MIYEYLVPIRVHISPPSAEMTHIKAFNPWNLASIAERSPPKTWTIASVSRQFRAELRSIVYPRTQIDINLQSGHRDAYQTWIKGLDKNVAASIHHLRIDDWIEVDRMPENAVPEFEWGYGFFRLLGQRVCTVDRLSASGRSPGYGTSSMTISRDWSSWNRQWMI